MTTDSRTTALWSLLNTAVHAAYKAGDAIMSVYERSFDVQWKADQSPVTEADLLAHEAIKEALKITGYPVRSEEEDPSPEMDWTTLDYYWLVDPLDGTREFIQRNGEFTVNIALIHDSHPLLGLVYAPANRLLYAGGPDVGFFHRQSNSSSASESDLSSDQDLTQVVGQARSEYVVAVSRSHADSQTTDYLNQLRQGKPVKTIAAGSAMKFCLVASGEADEYPRFGRTMEWDTAAGQALLMAVGKNIYSMKEGLPLRYGKKVPVNDPFVAR